MKKFHEEIDKHFIIYYNNVIKNTAKTQNTLNLTIL